MRTMTASPQAVPAEVVHVRARLQRIAVVGFPLLLIVSDLAVRGVVEGDTESYLASVADHRTGVLVGSILAMVAILLFAVTAQVISERLAPAMPRLAWYGKLVAWVGLFAGYAINAYGLVEWAMTDSTLSRPEMVRLMDTLQGVALPAVYQPGILTPLGFLALGIGLWRSHVVPTWTGAAFVFAAVTFPMGQIAGIFPAQVVCAALFLAGGIGLVLTARSAEAGRGSHEPATSFTPKTSIH